ncbi:MAG: family protein phosphatase [Acidimicrobiaceae bacterium]|jgi:serine/threonine protein phosphatase PrpC|nr:family protein phosphatase [Acidimicrobiaceae bacterium]
MTRLRWGSATDTGLSRMANEDSILAVDSLWVVADGMGGHAAGEVASRIAIDVLEPLGHHPIGSASELIDTVRQANDGIFQRASSQPELRGMGTTLTGLALIGSPPEQKLVIVNVGDSRAYVVQDRQLVQVSRDHSYVSDLVAAGEITAEQARSHPQRNIVTRALGIDPAVDVDAWEIPPHTGDRFLICSDGLVDDVEDADILQVLTTVDDPQQATDVLVRMANDAGGHDNISVIVVDVIEDAKEPAVASLIERAPSAEAAAGVAAPLPPTLVVAADGPPTEVGGWLPPDQPPYDTSPVPTPVVPADPADEPRPAPRQTKRRVKRTLRIVLFATVFLAIVAIALGGIGYYGRRGYFVAFAGNEVVVKQGQPGGVLWVKPTTARVLPLTRNDLAPKWQDRVASQNITFASLSAANEWYLALSKNPDAVPALATTTTSSSTTTTTTTAPPTTVAPVDTTLAASPPST